MYIRYTIHTHRTIKLRQYLANLYLHVFVHFKIFNKIIINQYHNDEENTIFLNRLTCDKKKVKSNLHFFD